MTDKKDVTISIPDYIVEFKNLLQKMKDQLEASSDCRVTTEMEAEFGRWALAWRAVILDLPDLVARSRMLDGLYRIIEVQYHPPYCASKSCHEMLDILNEAAKIYGQRSYPVPLTREEKLHEIIRAQAELIKTIGKDVADD